MTYLFKGSIFIFTVTGLLFLPSCRNKNELVEPKKEIWQQHPGFTFYASPIIKSTAFDDVFYSCGIYFISIMKKNQRGADGVQHYLDGGDINVPPIFSPLMIASPRNKLGVVSRLGDFIDFIPFTMVGNLNLRLNLANAIPGVQTIADSGSEWGAFSEPEGNRIKFLTSYQGDNEEVGLILLEMEYTTNAGPSLVKLINGRRIPLSRISQYIRKIRYINGSFYVIRDNTDSAQNQIIRVSTSGDILDLRSQLLSSTLCEGFVAYGKDTTVFYGDENRIAFSTNRGITWQQAGTFPLRVFNIHTVKDRMIGQPSLSQLVDINIKNMKFTEISKEGLPANTIQSVNYFKDTVYVSTFGSGMYKKSYQSVLNEIAKGEK